MKKVSWILWKDALAESRGLERLGTLTLFSAAILVTLNFAMPPDDHARRSAAAGFLWAAVLFASVLEFRRSFEAERRDGTLDALRLAPVDPAVLFVGKALSSLIVVAVLGAALVVFVQVVFVGRLHNTAAAIGLVVLGASGVIAWGTLFAAIASGTRAGELILPILLFPLVVPQTIACVRLLAAFIGGEQSDNIAGGFLLLGAFDVLSWGTSLLLFEYVLDE